MRSRANRLRCMAPVPGWALLTVHVDRRWVSLPGEGGHVDFAPNSEEEDIILEVLRAEVGHVSAERVLSGPGTVNLYRAIVKADNRLPEKWEPKDITERALADSCIDCRRALSLFCVIMGRFGGNGAESGHLRRRVHRRRHRAALYGILQGLGLPRRFRRQGRFRDYVREIPVFMITHGQPGLLGAGAHLRQTLGMHL